MFLTIFDLVLILILFLFIAFGFALGLVRTIGALLGVVIGGYLAGLFYEPFSAWLEPFFLGNINTARVMSFIIIFVVVTQLVGLIFYIVNKIFNIISIIPFTKSLNRLLGALFGLLEGVLILGLILYFISRFSFSDWFSGVLTASNVAHWLIAMASILTPLLPELLRQLKSVM